jgi:glycosyltransferase involved in cell wall biosynthesis
LDSLVNQDYPKQQYEIIVIDNGSEDTTLDIAYEFKKKNPKLLKVLIENKIKSSYAARNKGIESSKGDILCFIDADETVDNNFLKKIWGIFQSKEVDYLGYEVVIISNNRTSYGIYHQITGFPIEHYMKKLHFAPTCCLSVRKKVFNVSGKFDSRLISGGDYEFGQRAYRNGFIFYYNYNLQIFHPARDSFKRLLVKAIRTGRGLRQLTKYHNEYFKHLNRFLFDPRFFLPKRPGKLKEKNGYNFDINLRSRLFLIHWCIKIFEHFGYIYEKIFY